MDGPGYLGSAQAYHPIHHQMNMALKNKSLVWWDWIWESGGSSRRLDNQKTRILLSQMKRLMRDLPLNLDKIPTHFLMDVVLFGAFWACCCGRCLVDGKSALDQVGDFFQLVGFEHEQFSLLNILIRGEWGIERPGRRNYISAFFGNQTPSQTGTLMRTQRLKTRRRRKWCRWLSPCRGQSRTRGWRLLPRHWWRSRCDRHRQERQTACWEKT